VTVEPIRHLAAAVPLFALYLKYKTTHTRDVFSSCSLHYFTQQTAYI